MLTACAALSPLDSGRTTGVTSMKRVKGDSSGELEDAFRRVENKLGVSVAMIYQHPLLIEARVMEETRKNRTPLPDVRVRLKSLLDSPPWFTAKIQNTRNEDVAKIKGWIFELHAGEKTYRGNQELIPGGGEPGETKIGVNRIWWQNFQVTFPDAPKVLDGRFKIRARLAGTKIIREMEWVITD